MEKTIERFWSLFSGLKRVHGQYDIDEDLSSRKEKVTGPAYTRQEPVTETLWSKHLKGDQGLGIVPIRDDQKVVFAALDIDVYPLDLKGLNQQIQKLQLPFVVTRTKSGGAHLYVFFKEPVKAERVINRLKEMAKAIGFPSVEIFPKQRSLGPEDTGNWINMPYFDCVSDGKPTHHERYGLNDRGESLLEIEQYIDHCETKKTSEQAFMALEIEEQDRPFVDGPPCLQRMAEQESGFGEGSRNESLYQIGIYLRVKYDMNWQDKLEEFNHKYMSPPLKSSEVQNIIKSVSKEKNFYKCGKPPFEAVCGRETCLGRSYGIGLGANEGNGELELMLGSMKKSETRFDGDVIDDEVTWYWTIDGIEMKFSTSEVFSQESILKRIADRLKKLPQNVRPQRWKALLKEKIESAEIIRKDFEQSRYSGIWEALKDFVELKGDAEARVDVTVGRVYEEDDTYYFETKSFNDFLVNRGILKNTGDRTEIFYVMERHFGAVRKNFNLKTPSITKPAWVWAIKKWRSEDADLPPPKTAPREF